MSYFYCPFYDLTLLLLLFSSSAVLFPILGVRLTDPNQGFR